MPEDRKHERSRKSQLGQFFTPSHLAEEIVEQIPLKTDSKVLEPGCGNGRFVKALVHKFDELHSGNHRLNSRDRIVRTLETNLWATELDPHAFYACQKSIEEWYQTKRWGISFASQINHHFCCGDFLVQKFQELYDFIVGNPPFGGTIDYEHQDALDRQYGRQGDEKQWKIKKETYSFFIVKSVQLLKPGGQIWFICSDTFLTIKTMSGLRQYLMSEGSVSIQKLDYFSEETDYPMVLFKFVKDGPSDQVQVDDQIVERRHIELTGNFSWTITPEIVKYFDGPKIKDYMTCTSGMTTGKNEYFVREISDGMISETHEFEYFEDPITLKNELKRARLNKLSQAKQDDIKKQEADGATRRNVRITERAEPQIVKIPHEDYCYYNKASNSVFYENPKHVIYWKDDGDAVYTFKKNGNWYLHGVGGKPYFKREGVTWGLISTSINMRYLPPGYILDSGAPCGFLNEGIPHDELYFILGWCNTSLATRLLKDCINHTKNIQGKDVERLPYPFWIDEDQKSKCIELVKELVAKAHNEIIDEADIERLNNAYGEKDE